MGDHAVVSDITDYQQLLQLPEDTLVRDSWGEVWLVQHHKGEVWLSRFSDEYAFIVRPDGKHWGEGPPPLPIRPIQEVSPCDHEA